MRKGNGKTPEISSKVKTSKKYYLRNLYCRINIQTNFACKYLGQDRYHLKGPQMIRNFNKVNIYL